MRLFLQLGAFCGTHLDISYRDPLVCSTPCPMYRTIQDKIGPFCFITSDGWHGLIPVFIEGKSPGALKAALTAVTGPGSLPSLPHFPTTLKALKCIFFTFSTWKLFPIYFAHSSNFSAFLFHYLLPNPHK